MAVPPKLKVNLVYQHLIKRRLPLGLFSWRFLLPGQSASVRFHRNLIAQHYPRWPRTLVLLLVLFMGFKWALCYSPYYVYRVVNTLGKSRQKEIGLTLWQQYWRVLSISMGHGLSPSAWYQFRLYQPEQRCRLWDYVYDQEYAAFHAYRNRGRLDYRRHVAVLGDKWRFEQHLKEQGILGAGTFQFFSKGDDLFGNHLQSLIAQHGRLFCKPRTGNQGKGAFSAFFQGKRLCLQPRKENPLPDSQVSAYLHDRIQENDYLIQPDYPHHPRLRAALKGRDRPAVTLRIISSHNTDTTALEFAVLHWPVLDEAGLTVSHYPLAVQRATGCLDDTCLLWPYTNMTDTQQAELAQFIETLSGKKLPFWSEAVQLVQRTHSMLAGVDQIAWDFILSESRAVLLEGNSGWGGLAVCQWFGYDVKRYMEK